MYAMKKLNELKFYKINLIWVQERGETCTKVYIGHRVTHIQIIRSQLYDRL